MRRLRSIAPLLGLAHLLAFLWGCSNDPPPPAPPSADPQPPRFHYHLNEAQPRLPGIKLWLGPHEISAEIARTTTQIATGMMFRESLGENEGMLFVFPQSSARSFYMKNTRVPLTCAYINSEGVIEEIHDMQPLDETPIPSESDAIQYVLEMNQGWFQRHGIQPGALLSTEKGSLRETFFR